MTRWWNDPELAIAPEDLRRLDAMAALYPGWEITRRADKTWVAERRFPLPRQQEGDELAGQLAAGSLAELGGLVAGQERRASSARLWLIAGPGVHPGRTP
ncbi:hypothetical protein [Bailinhaonella thermotolerans]|uniref:Uncharacterized protein n=1 Tax=Bailinhaonella thermotolerans TaxID=1070861 RepID=A0A3A4BCK7_9ACTN|nr:hypothetical protein [Bailinhaonella thermotolerans]RJL35836.1 hypothetical protein D5H75_03380 [Bailinhaonella thermotolerans]